MIKTFDEYVVESNSSEAINEATSNTAIKPQIITRIYGSNDKEVALYLGKNHKKEDIIIRANGKVDVLEKLQKLLSSSFFEVEIGQSLEYMSGIN